MPGGGERSSATLERARQEVLVQTENGLERHLNVNGTSFKIPERYGNLKPVGKGSYGIVCSATDSQLNESVAIKKITPMAAHSIDAKHVLREVRVMRHLGVHENIITLKDLFCREEEDELYIVMELLESDLHRIIHSSQVLTDQHNCVFMLQLLRGVQFLHENNVIHRDLKPGNLLVTRNCELRISDFGLARAMPRSRTEPPVTSDDEKEEPMTEHVVTRWYRPPELMLSPNGFYGFPVDLWSVACIFAELIGRKPLFPGTDFINQLTLIFDVVGAPKPEEVAHIRGNQARKFLRKLQGKKAKPLSQVLPGITPQAASLLGKLLRFNPSERAKPSKALSHPYFKPFHDEPELCMTPPAGLNFNFDRKGVTKPKLRRLISSEISHFPSGRHLRLLQARGAARAGSSGSSSSIFSPALRMPAPSTTVEQGHTHRRGGGEWAEGEPLEVGVSLSRSEEPVPIPVGQGEECREEHLERSVLWSPMTSSNGVISSSSPQGHHHTVSIAKSSMAAPSSATSNSSASTAAAMAGAAPTWAVESPAAAAMPWAPIGRLTSEKRASGRAGRSAVSKEFPKPTLQRVAKGDLPSTAAATRNPDALGPEREALAPGMRASELRAGRTISRSPIKGAAVAALVMRKAVGGEGGGSDSEGAHPPCTIVTGMTGGSQENMGSGGSPAGRFSSKEGLGAGGGEAAKHVQSPQRERAKLTVPGAPGTNGVSGFKAGQGRVAGENMTHAKNGAPPTATAAKVLEVGHSVRAGGMEAAAAAGRSASSRNDLRRPRQGTSSSGDGFSASQDWEKKITAMCKTRIAPPGKLWQAEALEDEWKKRERLPVADASTADVPSGALGPAAVTATAAAATATEVATQIQRLPAVRRLGGLPPRGPGAAGAAAMAPMAHTTTEKEQHHLGAGTSAAAIPTALPTPMAAGMVGHSHSSPHCSPAWSLHQSNIARAGFAGGIQMPSPAAGHPEYPSVASSRGSPPPPPPPLRQSWGRGRSGQGGSENNHNGRGDCRSRSQGQRRGQKTWGVQQAGGDKTGGRDVLHKNRMDCVSSHDHDSGPRERETGGMSHVSRIVQAWEDLSLSSPTRPGIGSGDKLKGESISGKVAVSMGKGSRAVEGSGSVEDSEKGPETEDRVEGEGEGVGGTGNDDSVLTRLWRKTAETINFRPTMELLEVGATFVSPPRVYGAGPTHATGNFCMAGKGGFGTKGQEKLNKGRDKVQLKGVMSMNAKRVPLRAKFSSSGSDWSTPGRHGREVVLPHITPPRTRPSRPQNHSAASHANTVTAKTTAAATLSSSASHVSAGVAVLRSGRPAALSEPGIDEGPASRASSASTLPVLCSARGPGASGGCSDGEHAQETPIYKNCGGGAGGSRRHGSSGSGSSRGVGGACQVDGLGLAKLRVNRGSRGAGMDRKGAARVGWKLAGATGGSQQQGAEWLYNI